MLLTGAGPLLWIKRSKRTVSQALKGLGVDVPLAHKSGLLGLGGPTAMVSDALLLLGSRSTKGEPTAKAAVMLPWALDARTVRRISAVPPARMAPFVQLTVLPPVAAQAKPLSALGEMNCTPGGRVVLTVTADALALTGTCKQMKRIATGS